jgi:RNA polymerase sigma factor (TIGR02999 family)
VKALPLRNDALFEKVYARLKAMAGRRLASAHADTLQTTALVHELYLRIGLDEKLVFEDPAQFLAYAAHAMRHLLANRARDRMRQRAGGEWVRVTFTGASQNLSIDSAAQAIEIDEGLRRLEEVDARAARVVELIMFAGATLEEAATTLGVARRTVDRDWRFARAFLKAELG